MGESQRAVHAPRLELNAESAREWLDSDGLFGDLNEKERGDKHSNKSAHGGWPFTLY
jgi:hypothetical protein